MGAASWQRRGRLAPFIRPRGQGKSGEKPARSRHCDRRRGVASTSHWGATSAPGRRDTRRPGARRPARGSRFNPSRKGWPHVTRVAPAGADRAAGTDRALAGRQRRRPSSSSSASKATAETLDEGTWYVAGGADGARARVTPDCDPRRRTTRFAGASALTVLGRAQTFNRALDARPRLARPTSARRSARSATCGASAPIRIRTPGFLYYVNYVSGFSQRRPREGRARRQRALALLGVPERPAAADRPAVGQHGVRASARERPRARCRRCVHGRGQRARLRLQPRPTPGSTIVGAETAVPAGSGELRRRPSAPARPSSTPSAVRTSARTGSRLCVGDASRRARRPTAGGSSAAGKADRLRGTAGFDASARPRRRRPHQPQAGRTRPRELRRVATTSSGSKRRRRRPHPRQLRAGPEELSRLGQGRSRLAVGGACRDARRLRPRARLLVRGHGDADRDPRLRHRADGRGDGRGPRRVRDRAAHARSRGRDRDALRRRLRAVDRGRRAAAPRATGGSTGSST